METTVTQSKTSNGGLSNVLEIERLIIQRRLVMNQLAVLPQPFFSGPVFFFFLCDPLGLTPVGGQFGTYAHCD